MSRTRWIWATSGQVRRKFPLVMRVIAATASLVVKSDVSARPRSRACRGTGGLQGTLGLFSTRPGDVRAEPRGGPGETRSLTVLLVYVRVPDVVLKGEPQLGAEDNLAALFFDVKILLHHLGDPQVAERLARGLHRGGRGVFQGLSARPDHVDYPLHAHGILLVWRPDRDVRRSRRGLAGHRSAPAIPKFGQDLNCGQRQPATGPPGSYPTGLPPAGDDELTNTKKHHGITSRCHLPLCWAHEISSIVKPAPPKRGKPRSWAWTAWRDLRELWRYLSSASRRSRGRPRSGW